MAEPTSSTGRGKLSSIDLLPEEADEAIAWANAELRERNLPQTEILRTFNAMLADKGIKGVSKSAFGRHSVRLAVELRKLKAARDITEAVLARLPPGERSDATLALSELVKFRLAEMVTSDEEPSVKELANVTLALNRLSTIARREQDARIAGKKDQREDADREKADAEKEAEANRVAADKVEQIGSDAGLSAERIARIRREVLGVQG